MRTNSIKRSRHSRLQCNRLSGAGKNGAHFRCFSPLHVRSHGRTRDRSIHRRPSDFGITQREVRIPLGRDDELNRLISHYSVLEPAYSDQAATDRDQKVSLEKTCADCVDRMRQHGSTKRIKSLLAAIHDADSSGDRERLRSLQEELVLMRRATQ